jgi:hypothetical protein
MKPILRNADLEDKLKKEGYIVVPFLTVEEIAILKQAYYSEYTKTLDGMFATAHVPNIELRMKMNDIIKVHFARAIRETFCNATALGGSFIAKGKGEHGTLKPHQDWNIVDENRFRSFNVWAPLVDLNDNNGCICIMPGSHLWLKTYRSANLPSVYQQVESELWQSMKRLHLKAGEALIYDHRLIHASGENKSDEIRLATVFGVIPDEASMFYYHQKDDATVEEYQSNPEFFLYGNIFEGPKGLKLNSAFPFRFTQVSPKEFQRLLNPSPTLGQRIASLFTSN